MRLTINHKSTSTYAIQVIIGYSLEVCYKIVYLLIQESFLLYGSSSASEHYHSLGTVSAIAIRLSLLSSDNQIKCRDENTKIIINNSDLCSSIFSHASATNLSASISRKAGTGRNMISNMSGERYRLNFPIQVTTVAI